MLRLDRHVLKIYGSARQFASAAAGLRAGSELTGIATPACEAVLPTWQVTVQAAMDGARASSLELAPEAGDVLRSLQRVQLRTVGAVVPAAQLDAAKRKAALIGTVVPALAPRVGALVRRLERSAPSSPRQLVPAHGDFHPGQLLRAGGALHVLDLDSICLADPALDVAEYAAGATEAGSETAERLSRRSSTRTARGPRRSTGTSPSRSSSARRIPSIELSTRGWAGSRSS